ncbi:MAG: beta-N-acetylhexosaminidase [Legionella sp.]|uniref:beta-N-acetylhexosaminidase n=1 Tax=Legionella sp. TaxID=459 RepID=UPI0039E35BAA
MPLQFMIDIEGTELSEIECELLTQANVGAVILFTRNFINGKQLQKLVTDIKEINPDLFIATDHEGGNVQRFQRRGFSSIPAARAYGKVYDKDQQIGLEFAQEYGEIMANDLLVHGVNLSLAPILDLHNQCSIIAGLDRAFHHHPDAIIDLASAFIQGMNKAGMPAVGKHFPGHGSVNSDSHISMPVSKASLEELMANDLKPFIELIKKGLLPALMPAHVTYEAIDKENPAGFSSTWLKTILRTQLKFQGLILSDCLSMKGADIGDLNTRAQRALSAGCDMLIVCHQPRKLLLDLVQNQAIEHNPESVKRIAAFKKLMSQSKTALCSPSSFFEEKPSKVKNTTRNDEELNKTLTI